MIIIDTNVVSEMMRTEPDVQVVSWAATSGRLHTTAISIAEVSFGIARLPNGRRRAELAAVAAGVFADFAERICPFDTRAAREYGELVVRCERAGRPISTADAQIAAICSVRGATLATRNVGDFEATAIGVVNPWQGAAS